LGWLRGGVDLVKALAWKLLLGIQH
jgi:hypothetical protein